ncbi:hypothetical protein D9M72_307600 [compost metagenome]
MSNLSAVPSCQSRSSGCGMPGLGMQVATSLAQPAWTSSEIISAVAVSRSWASSTNRRAGPGFFRPLSRCAHNALRTATLDVTSSTERSARYGDSAPYGTGARDGLPWTVITAVRPFRASFSCASKEEAPNPASPTTKTAQQSSEARASLTADSMSPRSIQGSPAFGRLVPARVCAEAFPSDLSGSFKLTPR